MRFNPFDLAKAQKNDSYTVTISSSPNKGNIILTGFIEGNPDFNVSADYGAMSDVFPTVSGFIGAVSSPLGIMDSPQIADGFLTQRTYSGSSEVSLGLNIIEVDTYGTGEPVRTTKRLSKFLVPKNFVVQDLEEQVKDLIDGITNYDYGAHGARGKENLLKIRDALLSAFNNFMGSEIDSFGDVWTMVTNTLKEVTKTGADMIDDVDTFLGGMGGLLGNLSRYRVYLSIGDMVTDMPMVITDFSSNFSKESGKNGPLYTEYNLSLISYKTFSKDEFNSYFYSGKDLITIEYENEMILDEVIITSQEES